MNLESFNLEFQAYPEWKDCKVRLLGIRNHFKGDEETPYDDMIARQIGNDVVSFQASVDPGRFYIKNPINRMGCAELKPGLWKYGIGEHRNTHEALVQRDEVTVLRIDSCGRRVCEETGWWGLNIHSGGPDFLVGKWSAGCQVIKTSEPWKAEWLEFFEPIKNTLRDRPQSIIPYLLVDKLKALPV